MEKNYLKDQTRLEQKKKKQNYITDNMGKYCFVKISFWLLHIHI